MAISKGFRSATSASGPWLTYDPSLTPAAAKDGRNGVMEPPRAALAPKPSAPRSAIQTIYHTDARVVACALSIHSTPGACVWRRIVSTDPTNRSRTASAALVRGKLPNEMMEQVRWTGDHSAAQAKLDVKKAYVFERAQRVNGSGEHS